MTKNQKIKIFSNVDPQGEKRSTEDRVNEFLQQDSINALGIAMFEKGITVLYEEKVS